MSNQPIYMIFPIRKYIFITWNRDEVKILYISKQKSNIVVFDFKRTTCEELVQVLNAYNIDEPTSIYIGLNYPDIIIDKIFLPASLDDNSIVNEIQNELYNLEGIEENLTEIDIKYDIINQGDFEDTYRVSFIKNELLILINNSLGDYWNQVDFIGHVHLINNNLANFSNSNVIIQFEDRFLTLEYFYCDLIKMSIMHDLDSEESSCEIFFAFDDTITQTYPKWKLLDVDFQNAPVEFRDCYSMISLISQKKKINHIPSDIINRRKDVNKKLITFQFLKLVLKFQSILFVLLICFILLNYFRLNHIESILTTDTFKFEQVKELIKNKTEYLEFFSNIDNLNSRRSNVSSIFFQIEKLIPPSVEFLKMNITRNNSSGSYIVNITGSVINDIELYEMIDKLAEDAEFDKVELISSTKQTKKHTLFEIYILK